MWTVPRLTPHHLVTVFTYVLVVVICICNHVLLANPFPFGKCILQIQRCSHSHQTHFRIVDKLLDRDYHGAD